MKYRRFGRTELQMPVFTCGGMRFQHGWKDEPAEGIPASNQDNLEKTVQRALELGINHIETARGYGTSEMQLGRILPHLPREEIIIQTKITPAANPNEFLNTFETSLQYLKIDKVDLLSIHGINDEETLNQSIGSGGCVEVVRKLQEQGRVRFMGFSTHGPLDIILRTIYSGEFDYVNLHWYFVNDFNWPAVLAARARDMGVFIISPNDKGGMLYKPSEKLRQLCEPLSPMAFNNLYCLARNEVHTLSIGAARPEDFDEHIASLAFYDKAAQTAAPIEARIREEMAFVLGDDWCEGWWKHLPEFHQLPNQINLLEILRLWTFAKSLDLVEFGKMRYNLLGNAGHWFPGTNASTFDEHALLKSIQGHPFVEKIPAILREAHQLLKGEEKKRLSQS